jgi:hypothetical protein
MDFLPRRPRASGLSLSGHGLAAPLVVSAALLPGLLAPSAGLAQQQGYGQTLGTTPLERQLYDANPRGGSGGGSPLETGNPLDIMNVIRRNASLSEATPPSSAIDDALKEFETQAGPASATPRLPGP